VRRGKGAVAMTVLIPQLGLFALVTTGVAAEMIRLGLGHGLLRLRQGGRKCPSCDRLIEGRVCRKCAGVSR
jgi:hypothetical protein